MKHIFIFLTLISFPAFAQDIDTQFNKMLGVEKQIADFQAQYNREKQNNDQRLMRIQQAKSNGNTQAAALELQNAYVAAERLGQLNGMINDKERELDSLCSEWAKLYGPSIDALLTEAENNKNAKKRGEIGARLQKYQSLNTRLCIKAADAIPTEWRSLQIERYDGPQEINQKVQLLKDISREMSIGLTRLEQQFQQASKERSTRERAQEFVDEGTLFDGGITVRSSSKGGIDTNQVPLAEGPDRNSPEPGEVTPTGVVSVGSSWNDLPSTEADFKKQRAELVRQQEELRNKIKEFEEKEKALLKP
jgi:hypothetical protein